MVLSTLLQNRVVLFPISELRGPLFTSPKLPDPGPLSFPSEPRGTLLFYFRTTWTSIYLLASEPRGSPIHSRTMWLPIYFRAVWSTLYLLQSCMVYSLLWLPRLGLNPSTHLPLQPHLRLLLQSATPASIPVFFQLYWAVIVRPGRCGPMAWSQSSPSSHTGPVTRGSCFPVPSWVEVTPIFLAQSRATAI